MSAVEEVVKAKSLTNEQRRILAQEEREQVLRVPRIKAEPAGPWTPEMAAYEDAIAQHGYIDAELLASFGHTLAGGAA